tara:strand:- start:304 stop:456 length:153 start_codon:yes stop_codon:yes gene_type:complete
MTPILTGVAPTIPIKKLREQSAKENQRIIKVSPSVRRTLFNNIILKKEEK